MAGPKGAWADSFYNWTFAGDKGNAAGTFQVDNSNIVVAILNGTVTDFPGSTGPITSLLAPDTFVGNDNIFNPLSPFLTSGGVSFTTNIPLNIYYANGVWFLYDSNVYSSGTFAAALSQ